MAQTGVKTFDTEEEFRLSELYRLNLIDTPVEAEFDAIVQLGKQLFNSAFCTIVFLDDQRQWFKAKAGALGSQTSKDASFCKYTIQSDSPNVINDATLDPRVKHSPLVVNSPWIRSYLGIPLKTLSGARLGTYCVIDTKPREWIQSEIELAKKLAAVIEQLIRRKEVEQNLGHRPVGQLTLNVFNRQNRFGSWELKDGESLIRLTPSLRQMFGLSETLPIHRDWFDRFGVNRPLNCWIEFADQLDGIEPIRFSILRPDGERVYFEETLYIKEINSKKTLVGLVQRVDAPNTTELIAQAGQNRASKKLTEQLSMSVFDFLLNKSHGYLVINNKSKIVALFDHWTDSERQRPPPVQLNACFSEDDCQQILGTFDRDDDTPSTAPVFVKLKLGQPHDLWFKIQTHKHIDGPGQATERIVEFVQLVEQPEVNQQIQMAHAMCDLLEHTTNSGTWACSIQGLKVHPTSQMCMLMNIRPAPSPSKDYFFERLSEITQQDMFKRIDEVIRRKAKWSLEFETNNAIGALSTYYCNIEPRISEQGEVIGLQGVLCNTTTLRDAQRKLIDLENLSTQLLAHIAEGVVEVNDQGLVNSINEPALEILGISGKHQGLGEPISKLLGMTNESTLLRLTQTMSAHGSSQPTRILIEASETWVTVQVFAKTKGYCVLLSEMEKTRQ